jgi:hypothetical protein
MSISIDLNFITGLMLGFEHVCVEDSNYIVIDILFVRIVIEIENGN